MHIEKNKVTFLMGENGAGKTTLLKCLLKLEPFEGGILYDGEPLEAVRSKVHVIYDDSPFYDHLSGYQNIKLLINKPVGKEELEQLSQKFLSRALLKKRLRPIHTDKRKSWL